MHAVEPLRLLIVCTANRCRSPLAEHLFRRRLDEAGVPWTVTSCGTRARAGRPMDPHAAAVLAERGIDPGDWVSSPLPSPAELAGADLILTAEARHRAEVVAALPRALSRTLLIGQFARIASAAGALPTPPRYASTAELLHVLAEVRGELQPGGAADEVADPIGGTLTDFRTCAERLDELADATVAALRS